MKLLKFIVSSIVFVILVIIALLTIPFFLLVDGGVEAFKTLVEPTVFGKAISERMKAAH